MVRINLTLATIFIAALMAAAAFSSSLSAATKVTVAVDYGKLPLIFEPNQGQTDAPVKFLSRGRGYSLFLTESEAVLSLRGAGGKSHTLRVKLLGAASAPKMTGLARLPGISNYFIGNDQKKWRTGVPHYAKVGYEDVYPGIDLVFYGTGQRQLEYDFIVAPGADPSAIALAFEGAERLEIDEAGNLIAHLPDGEVRFLKPVVYQMKDGARRRVVGDYVLTDDRISFALGAYDPAEPLVIDPVLAYSTYLGGSLNDQARDVAVDADGSAYIAGWTRSVDFTASLDGPIDGDTEAYVAKIAPDGSAMIYVAYLGGASSDRAYTIAVDVDGRAYVSGGTCSANFPTTFGALQPDFVDGDCLITFVAILGPDGDKLEYASFFYGGDVINGVDVHSIALRPGCPDESQSEILCKIYIGGSTRDAGLTTTPGAFQPTLAGELDGFLAVIDPGGLGSYDLLYSTYLGGVGVDFVRDVAVDAYGDAYVVGGTASEDFPTSPTAYDQGCGDDADPNDCIPAAGRFPNLDAFVAKISPLGNGDDDLVYSTYVGGTEREAGGSAAIAVDAAGYAYITGDTRSSDFPTTVGAFKFVSNGGDAFVAKLNQDGSDLVYSTYLGGRDGSEQAHGIALRRPGCPTGCSVYITGQTRSTDFPTTVGAIQTEIGWVEDAFLTLVNADGSDLLYSTYIGGSTCEEGSDGSCSNGGERAWGLAVDPAGHAYIAGTTSSDDFPTKNALDDDCGNDFVLGDCTDTSMSDAFVAKFEDLSASNPNSIHVGNVDLIELLTGKKAWTALLAVTMHFPDEAIAGEVMVTGQWRGESGYDHSAACALPSSGVCEIASGEIPNKNGAVTFTVEVADLSGFVYDPSADHDPDPDSNGTTITVPKPSKSSGGGGGGGGKSCNPKKPGCN